ncbi:MAG: hypothetical protein GF320_05010 [Armatimonadia bacterium]|nr:hypothetical protein [Armatimonadia bacterium]
MRTALALIASALLGAVMATGLATRVAEPRSRPAPVLREPTATERAIDASLHYFAAREIEHEGRREAEVLAAGDVVIRIRSSLDTSLGPMDPYERAMLMARRLNALAERGPIAGGVEVSTGGGGQVCVTCDGVILVVVDAATANRNGSSPQSLARKWQRRIGDALERAWGAVPRQRHGDGEPSPRQPKTTLMSGGARTCALQADGHGPEPHFRAREDRPAGREVGEVVVGDIVVMRVLSRRLELSPYERAIISAKRLNDFVADYGLEGPLRLQEDPEAGELHIMGGDLQLATADPSTARLREMSVEALAQEWLERVSQVLAEPPPGSGRPFDSEPALAPDEPAEDEDDAEPGEPAADTSARPGPVHEEGYIPMVGAGSGEQVGRAEVVGPEADMCDQVLVVEGLYEGAARMLVFIPTQVLRDDGPRRVDCGVSGFALPMDPIERTEAHARTRCAPVPVQRGFGLREMLRVAGVDEAVKWFSNELDRHATTLAANELAAPLGPTLVVPVRHAATGVDFAAAQVRLPDGGGPEPVRLHARRDDSGMWVITPMAEDEAGRAAKLNADVLVTCWIDLPEPEEPARRSAA